MEKVFTPYNDKKKFDVTQLSDAPTGTATTLDIGGERYDDSDYECRRNNLLLLNYKIFKLILWLYLQCIVNILILIHMYHHQDQ